MLKDRFWSWLRENVSEVAEPVETHLNNAEQAQFSAEQAQLTFCFFRAWN